MVADLAFRHARDAQRQGDVVAGAEMIEQPKILKDDADAAAQRGPSGAGRSRVWRELDTQPASPSSLPQTPALGRSDAAIPVESSGSGEAFGFVFEPWHESGVMASGHLLVRRARSCRSMVSVWVWMIG